MGNYFDESVGRAPLSLTIRMGLKPLYETQDNIEKNGRLISDFERDEAYPVVKRLKDEMHRQFIENALNDVEKMDLSWFEILSLKMSSDPKETKSEIQNLKQDFAKRIISNIKKSDLYEELWGQTQFKDGGKLLKLAETEEEKDAVHRFQRFTTFFTNYNNNREYMYSDNLSSGTIVNRIMENFDFYCQNFISIKKVEDSCPELYVELKDEWESSEKITLEDVISENGYRYFISPQGVDLYNRFVALYNYKVNLYYQSKAKSLSPGHPLHTKKNRTLLIMYKQILCDSDSLPLYDEFENGEDVIASICDVIEKNNKDGVFEGSLLLFKEFEDYNTNDIYVPKSRLSTISLKLFNNWSTLETILSKGNEKNLGNYISVDTIGKEIMSYYNNAVNETDENTCIEKLSLYCQDEKFSMGLFFNDELERLVSEASNKIKVFSKFVEQFDENTDLQNNISSIKDLLDSMCQIGRWLKLFYDTKLNIEDADLAFYNRLIKELDYFRELDTVYNKVRNYLTKKPFSTEKIHLKFDRPTLGDGWSIDKESSNGAIILRKNDLYYLGVMDTTNKPEINVHDERLSNCYEKMKYCLFKDVSKMIPKCSTALKDVKKAFANGNNEYVLNGNQFTESLLITKRIYTLSVNGASGCKTWQKEYLKKTGNIAEYKAAVKDWITFCYRFLNVYSSTRDYDFSSLLPLEQFEHVSDFYKECDKILYKIDFVYVDENEINKLVKEEKLYLFQIYNKDFSPNKRKGSKKNLHTLYFEALFSDFNRVNRIAKLNGGAELFFREASIKEPYRHNSGSVLVNKHTKNGEPIPASIYTKLCDYVNNSCGTLTLTDEERLYWENTYTTTKSYDIVKDKRYAVDHYEIHIPITLNYNSDGVIGANQLAVSAIKQHEDINVIGLDRGERNLIAYSVVTPSGDILEQGTFNKINGVDYQEKLKQKESERQKAREEWEQIKNIKELKEGYISQVIHELYGLIIKYNAVIAMEDLNVGFKRGRFKVERQVYQKFEVALIKKLNYLVTSKLEDDAMENGGVLRGYQLTDIPRSWNNIGKQCGCIFYVQPSYTSKIDPTTGFADVFNYTNLTNAEKRRNFFGKMTDISFDEEKDMFAFTFNYDNFDTFQSFYKKEWTVYSNGSRYVYNPAKKETNVMVLTDELKSLLDDYNVDYKEKNLKEQIINIDASKGTAGFWSRLLFIFKTTLKMRNSKPGSAEDRIISPVCNADGGFYESPEYDVNGFEEKHKNDKVPMDADTNGAYNIAMKGLLVMDKIRKSKSSSEKALNKELVVSNAEWFEYIQKL